MSFENILAKHQQALSECADFLMLHLPGWQIDAIDPIEGLRTGIVSCSGRVAVAVTYLELRGEDIAFAYQKNHGAPNRYGPGHYMGHVLGVAPRIVPDEVLTIDSNNLGICEVVSRSNAGLEGYNMATSLEEGFNAYCGRIGRTISLNGLTEAVASRME